MKGFFILLTVFLFSNPSIKASDNLFDEASMIVKTRNSQWPQANVSAEKLFSGHLFQHPQLANALGLNRYWRVRGKEIAKLEFDLYESAQSDPIGGPPPYLLEKAPKIGAVGDFKDGNYEDIPNDPMWSDQYALPAIDAPRAWFVSETLPVEPVIVAVVDSGINPHDDLRDNLLDEGFSTVHPIFSPDPFRDDCNHGTSVAGIVAAVSDNGLGIAGTSRNAKLLPIQVMNGGCQGLQSWAAEGVVLATDFILASGKKGVISQSLRYYDHTQLYEDANEYAYRSGLLVVVASGNEAFVGSHWPAKFESTMAVAAVKEDMSRAPYSSVDEVVEITAPGDRILTTSGITEYAYFSGTSASTPVVAGVAAQVWGVNTTVDNKFLRNVLKSTADDMEGLSWSPEYGEGVADLHQALLFSQKCYSDINRDGFVNLFDFNAFLNFFEMGHPVGDCDDTSGNGVFDTFDWLCFSNMFDTLGCGR